MANRNTDLLAIRNVILVNYWFIPDNPQDPIKIPVGVRD